MHSHALAATGTRPCQDTLSDTALIVACQDGSREAWDQLITRYDPQILRLAYRYVGNHDDAGDLASLVHLRLYEKIGTFHPGSCFSAWLTRMVRNAFIDHYVRASQKPAPVSLSSLFDDHPGAERDLPDNSVPLDARAVEEERNRAIHQAVRYLPGYQRTLIELYYTHDRTYPEIAEITGLRLGTVKSRLFRARQMLRERLKPSSDLL